MRPTLYQPELPQNGRSVLRLAPCLGVVADLIGPYEFLWGDRRRRCAEMNYLDAVKLTRIQSWAALDAAREGALLVLPTMHGGHSKSGFWFAAADVFLLCSESGDVREDVHVQADQRMAALMAGDMCWLNVAAIALGKALHQTDGFPATGVMETVP